MVKGISKQIIVVDPPEPKLFEQAIFILKEDAPGITDEALLKEAKQMLKNPTPEEKPCKVPYGRCAEVSPLGSRG